VLNLEERLGVESEKRLRCDVEKVDYYEYFKDFGFDAKICSGCWSNQKLYDKMYGGLRHYV
jgi:hypothetical protein